MVIPNKAIRKALESRYHDSCSAYIYVNETDPITKLTTQKRVALFENEPCRLSYQTQAFASLVSSQDDGIPSNYQSCKMFIAPEWDIPENSEIEVIRQGRLLKFKRSSVPILHQNHQEVMVEVFDQDG